MLALARNSGNDIFNLGGVVEIEEVWRKRDREIDKAGKVEWTYVEHPRNAIDHSKFYMRVYLARERLGVNNKDAEKKLKKKKGKKIKFKKMKDKELQDAFEEINRIEEKLEYLEKKKKNKNLSARKRKKFVQRYEYLWQYRRAVRSAGSRLKRRVLDYEKCYDNILQRQEAELEYIRQTKTSGERFVEQLKGAGAKILVGMGAAMLSMPLTDEWPYWGAVGVGGTFLGHFLLRTYAWTAEDKAILKYQKEFEDISKELEHEKAEVYVQTTFLALNALEDSLKVNTRRKTFLDYRKEARKIKTRKTKY
ncbi:MAG: hypothetical protein ACE5J7_03060 [Candidatus Aenigmatarchaeota archaeon]